MVLPVVGGLTPPLVISVWAPKSSLLSRDVNLTVNYVRNTGRVTHSFNRLAVCALETERERERELGLLSGTVTWTDLVRCTAGKDSPQSEHLCSAGEMISDVLQ
jgi:hypothetical protein